MAKLTLEEQSILDQDGGDVNWIAYLNEDYKRLNGGVGLAEYEAILTNAGIM